MKLHSVLFITILYLTGVIALYGISRTLSWVIVSSGIVAVMPYNMESMRQEMVDTQKAQEKSVSCAFVKHLVIWDFSGMSWSK